MKRSLKYILIINLFISVQNIIAQSVLLDSIYSSTFNSYRNIDIYVPYGDEKFPVIYVLDAQMHFGLLKEHVAFLSGDNMSIIPKMIVVGIHSKDRYLELTPNEYKMGPYDKMGGDGPKLTAFITQELIPHIDKNYNTAPYRTYVGHALGGLHVLNTMMDETNVFNNYVISDPSMFWGNNYTINKLKKEFNSNHLKEKQLYIAASNSTGNPNAEPNKILESTEISSLFLRNILILNNEISTQKDTNYQFNYFENDSHSTVAGSAYYDALKHLFSWYYFPKNTLFEYYSKTSKKTPEDLTAKLNGYYKMISKNLGYTIRPKEKYIKDLASYFKKIGKPEFEKVLLDLL